YCIKNDCSRLL
ncbi:hypothetical protein KM1_136400, partial [Entamoeba histolytica HM-3:IMSS]